MKYHLKSRNRDLLTCLSMLLNMNLFYNVMSQSSNASLSLHNQFLNREREREEKKSGEKKRP
jgi:hypothetical protein